MYNSSNEQTTIKEAAIKFDIFIRDGGIGASMFFSLILLIIVNTHSLHFLFGDGVLSWVFSVVGAIGFSLATTAIIRKPVSNWMKYLFPIFDTILVFVGFNLNNPDIPVHLVLTILYALFTGLILLSLGTINFKENEQLTENQDYKSKISNLVDELELSKNSNNEWSEKHKELHSDFVGTCSKLENTESELNYMHIEFKKCKVIIDKQSNEIRTNQTQIKELDKYKQGYLSFEAGRIRKKLPKNRTEADNELLKQIEGDEKSNNEIVGQALLNINSSVLD